MSSYLLLEWGVQIPYLFHEKQTPRVRVVGGGGCYLASSLKKFKKT